MIECKYKLSEAPCRYIVVRGFMRDYGPEKGQTVAAVFALTDESGEEIPMFSGSKETPEWKQVQTEYAQQIAAAIADCRKEILFTAAVVGGEKTKP